MINIIYKMNNRPLSVISFNPDLAERKMLKMIQRYHYIMDSLHDLMCRFLPDGTITLGNPAFYHYLHKLPEEAIGLNITSYFHQDQNELDYILKKLAEDGLIKEIRCQPGSNRDLRWFKCTYIRAFDPNIEEIQLVAHQINQESITTFLQQHKIGIDNKCDIAGLPVVILQPDLTIYACNHMFERFSGYSSEEILGQELSSVLVIPDLLEIILIYKALPQTTRAFEVQCLDRFGNIRDVVINTSSLNQNGRLVLTFVDVSKKYVNNDLIQTLRDDSLIVVCNTKGVVLAINRLCEDVVGLYNEQIKGLKYWEVFCPDQEKNMAKRLFKTVLVGKDSIEIKQNWLVAKGQTKTILLRNFPLLNLKGDIEYIILSGKVVEG